MNKIKLFLISVLLSIIMCFPSYAGKTVTSSSSWKEGNVTVVQINGYHGQALNPWKNYMSFGLLAYDAQGRVTGTYLQDYRNIGANSNYYTYLGFNSNGYDTRLRSVNSHAFGYITTNGTNRDQKFTITDRTGSNMILGTVYSIDQQGDRFVSSGVRPNTPKNTVFAKPYTNLTVTGQWSANQSYSFQFRFTDLHPAINRIQIAYAVNNGYHTMWDTDPLEWVCINHNGVLQHDAWNHWWHCSSCGQNYGTAPHASNTWRYDANNLGILPVAERFSYSYECST